MRLRPETYSELSGCNRCLKRSGGLFDGTGPNGLTEREQVHVGLLPKARPHPRARAFVALMAAAGLRADDEHLQFTLGLRYLIDLGEGGVHELSV